MGNAAPKQVQQYRYPSGNVYSGEMRGRMRHGQGSLTWTDGATYVGMWQDDLCHGHGKMTFPNGSSYEGQFVRNNPHGDGQLVTINQELLKGNWVHTGRSNTTNVPVGKYQFYGQLIDMKTNTVRVYNGPLALYLTSGLVSMPQMPDPMQSMLPYAEVAAAVASGSVKDEKSDKYDQVGAVPVAQVVREAVEMAPTTSSSIVYGQPEIALHERDLRTDHARIEMFDPRTILGSLGVPVGPPNLNERRQMEIQMNIERQYGGQRQ